jgi:hypothetical protein
VIELFSISLTELIGKAVQGESFVIAESDTLMVTASAYTPPPYPAVRLGFLKGRLEVPEDFDSMGMDTIQATFDGKICPRSIKTRLAGCSLPRPRSKAYRS